MKQVENIPGYGIKAVVKGIDVTIANASYYEKNEINLPPTAIELEKELKQTGKTAMIVYIDNRYAGMVAVFDEIRQTSFTAISRLKQIGLPVILLTGDHHESGVSVAIKVGIKEVFTECNPQDKSEIVQQLQREGHQVTMVGDGINDAPAHAVADVGVVFI